MPATQQPVKSSSVSRNPMLYMAVGLVGIGVMVFVFIMLRRVARHERLQERLRQEREKKAIPVCHDVWISPTVNSYALHDIKPLSISQTERPDTLNVPTPLLVSLKERISLGHRPLLPHFQLLRQPPYLSASKRPPRNTAPAATGTSVIAEPDTRQVSVLIAMPAPPPAVRTSEGSEMMVGVVHVPFVPDSSRTLIA